MRVYSLRKSREFARLPLSPAILITPMRLSRDYRMRLSADGVPLPSPPNGSSVRPSICFSIKDPRLLKASSSSSLLLPSRFDSNRCQLRLIILVLCCCEDYFDSFDLFPSHFYQTSLLRKSIETKSLSYPLFDQGKRS